MVNSKVIALLGYHTRKDDGAEGAEPAKQPIRRMLTTTLSTHMWVVTGTSRENAS